MNIASDLVGYSIKAKNVCPSFENKIGLILIDFPLIWID